MNSEGSSRWVLVADPENRGRWLWEWNIEGADDISALFERVRDGSANGVDHELFDACMMDRFAASVYAGESVEPWLMQAIADRFTKVLAGGELCDEFRLPGRPTTDIRPWREQRDLEIFCNVSNAVREGSKVVAAITDAANQAAVSLETARAAYYKWSKQLSKSAPEL